MSRIRLAISLVLLMPLACDSPDPVEPNFGIIEVTALAEGTGELPSNFTVLFNGSPSGQVVANSTYTIPYLPPGQYELALVEESENCFYGANERTVTVEPNETAYTTFLVRCDPAE